MHTSTKPDMVNFAKNHQDVIFFADFVVKCYCYLLFDGYVENLKFNCASVGWLICSFVERLHKNCRTDFNEIFSLQLIRF